MKKILKLIALCEKHYEEDVYLQIFSDGSGAILTFLEDEELFDFDSLKELEDHTKTFS
jgi:hypothetical protein